MNKSLRRALIISTFLGSFTNLQAISPKAEKFLSILEKKPESEFLFDRFYDLYIQEATAADLEALFDERYKETKDKTYLQLKAALFEEENETGRALELYDQIVDANSSAFLFFKRGFLQFSELNFKEAVKDLQQALKKSPSEKLQIKIAKLIGKIHIREMEVEKGLAVWLELLKKVNDENLAEEILELMIGEGLYEQAQTQIAQFIKATESNHRKIALMLRQGDLYRKQEQKGKALEMYAGSLELVGAGSWVEKEILSQIEQVFRAEDDLNGLLDFYGKLLEVRKQSIPVMKRQAGLLTELGDVDEADKLYLEIIKLTPENRGNRELYSRFLVKQEKYKNALAIIEGLIREAPEDGELLISMANLADKLKDKTGCINALKKYNALNKNSELALSRTAELLTAYELPEEALAVYTELVKTAPDNREAKLMRAYTLYTLDKKGEALNEYKQLAEACSLEELQSLIMILNGVGEYKVAAAILDKRTLDFSTDYKFQKLCNESAVRLNNVGDQFLTARNMVKTAVTFEELKNGVSNFIYTARKQGKYESLAAELTAQDKKSCNETILFSEMLFKNERKGEAFKVLNTLKDEKGVKAMALRQQLVFQKADSQWAGACDTLKQLIKREPKTKVKFLTELVDAYMRDDKSEEALAVVEEWKKASPNATSPYLKQAMIYRENSDNLKATAVLKKAMFKFQDDKNIPKVLASNLTEDGDFRSARSIYWNELGKTEALSEKLSYINLLKVLSERDGSFESLKARLVTRMENNPKSVFPILALAEVCRYRDYEARRDYLIKATSLRSKDTALLREIARIEDEEGHYDRALTTLKKIHEIDQNTSSKQGVISFYLKNGEDELAMNMMMEPVKGKQIELDDVVKIAESMLKSHSPILDKFITPFYIKNPSDHRLILLKGLALMDMDKTERAAELFISVLSLPDSDKSDKVSSKNNSVRSHLRTIFDQKTVEFMIEHQFFNTGNLYYRLQNRQRNGLQVPTTRKEAKSFALACAMKLISSMEKTQQVEALEQMSRNGLPYAEIHFFAFRLQSNMTSLSSNIPELKKRYAAQPEVVNCLTFFHLQLAKTQKEFDQLVSEIKQDNPRLLPLLFQRYNRNNKKITDDSVYDIAAAELLKMPNENFFSLASGLITSDKVSESIRQKLRSKTKELFVDKTAKSYMYYFKNALMIQVMIEEDDYPGLVNVFNVVTEEFAKNKNSFPYGYYGSHHYRGRGSKLFNPLDFNSLSSGKIDGQLVSALSRNRSGSFYRRTEGLKVLDGKKFAPHIKSITSPLVRFYAYNSLKDTENAEKTAEEIIKTLGKKDLAEFKLFAAWFIQENKFEKAVDTLNKAIDFTVAHKTLKQLSAAALFYSSKCKGEAYKKAAKAYADRLLKMKLTLEEKGEIAGYLTTLGYVAEAEKMEAQIRAAFKKKAGSSASRSRSSSSRTQTPREKIRTLFQDKKFEEALKLTSREFRKMVRSVLVISNNGNNNWELRNILDSVRRYKKVDEFLAGIKPAAEGAAARSLIEYAYACQFYGKTKEAVDYYRRALEKNENHRAANLYLGILLAAEGDADAFKKIKKAVGSNWNYAGQILYEQINQNRYTTSLLDYIPIVTEFVRQLNLTPGVDNNLWSIRNCIENLDNSIHLNGLQVNIPDILNPKQDIDESDEKKRKAAEAFRDERRKLCLELYKEAVKHPLFQQSSFGKLNELLRREGQSFKARAELAKQALTAASAAVGNRYPSSKPGRQSFDHVEIKLHTPISLLVSYAFIENKYEEIIAFSRQEAIEGLSLKDELELMKPLFDVPEEQFIEKVHEFFKEQKDEQRRQLPVVIEVYSLRKLKKAKLSDLILETFKTRLSEASPHNQVDAEHFKTWLNTLKDDNRFDEAVQFLKAAFIVLSKEVKQHFDDKYPDEQSMRQDQLWWQFERFFRAFSDVCTEGQLMGAFFQEISKADSRAIKVMAQNSGLSWRFRSNYEKICMDKERLLETSLCADLEAFDPIINPVSDNNRRDASALAVFVSRTSSSSRAKKVKEALSEVETKTFGVELLLKLVETQKVQDVFTFMDSKLEQFKQLPKAQQNRFIITFVPALKENYNFRREINKVSGTFFEYIKEGAGEVLVKKYEEFIQKKIVSNNEYNYRREAAALISELVEQHDDLAQKVFDRAASELKLYYLKNLSNYQNNSDTPLARMVGDIDDDMTEKKALFLFKNLPKIEFLELRRKFDFVDRVVRELRYDVYSKDQKQKNDQYFLAIKFFVDHFPKEEVGEFSIIRFIRSTIFSMNEEGYGKLLELEAVKTAQSGAMKELQVVCRYQKQRRKDSKAAVPADFISFYNSFLQNKAKSVQMKASALESALYPVNYKHAEQLKAVVYEACDVLAQLPKEDLDIVDEDAFEGVIVAMSQIEEADEKWKSASQNMLTLLKRFPEAEVSREFSIRQSYDNTKALGLFDLYLRSGQIEKVKSMVKNADQGFGSVIDTYLLLAIRGYLDEAAMLFADYGIAITPSTRRSNFTKSLLTHETVEAFIAKLAFDEQMQLLARIYIEHNRRSYDKFEDHFMAFEALDISDLKLKQKFVKCFFLCSRTEEYALKYAHLTFKAYSPKLALAENDSTFRRFYANHLVGSLKQISDEKLKEILDEIVNYTNNEENRRSYPKYLAREISGVFMKYLTRDEKGEQLDKFIEIGKTVIQSGDYYSSLRNAILGTTVVLYNRGDKSKLQDWLDTFDQNKMKSIRKNYYHIMWNYLKQQTAYENADGSLNKSKLKAAKKELSELLTFKKSPEAKAEGEKDQGQ